MSGSPTRVFFVVDSIEDNPEIFDRLSTAELCYQGLSAVRVEDYIGDPNNRRLYVALVNNAYSDSDGNWNYDDQADTFEIVKILKSDSMEQQWFKPSEIAEQKLLSYEGNAANYRTILSLIKSGKLKAKVWAEYGKRVNTGNRRSYYKVNISEIERFNQEDNNV